MPETAEQSDTVTYACPNHSFFSVLRQMTVCGLCRCRETDAEEVTLNRKPSDVCVYLCMWMVEYLHVSFLIVCSQSIEASIEYERMLSLRVKRQRNESSQSKQMQV